MINMEWNHQFEVGERVYEVDGGIPTEIPDGFYIKGGNRIPFIACFSGMDHIRMDRGTSPFRGTVAVDVLMAVFMTGRHLIRVKVRSTYYLVGKGILMDLHNKVLAMICVTREFYENFPFVDEIQPSDIRDHFFLVMHHDFMNELAFRGVYARFRQLLSKNTINVETTWDAQAPSFIKREFPTFRTTEQRRTFTRQLVEEVLENVLIHQVI